jgi:hypothetical protein
MVDRGVLKAEKFAGAVHIPREEVERIERETARELAAPRRREQNDVSFPDAQEGRHKHFHESLPKAA